MLESSTASSTARVPATRNGASAGSEPLSKSTHERGAGLQVEQGPLFVAPRGVGGAAVLGPDAAVFDGGGSVAPVAVAPDAGEPGAALAAPLARPGSPAPAEPADTSPSASVRTVQPPSASAAAEVTRRASGAGMLLGALWWARAPPRGRRPCRKGHAATPRCNLGSFCGGAPDQTDPMTGARPTRGPWRPVWLEEPAALEARIGAAVFAHGGGVDAAL